MPDTNKPQINIPPNATDEEKAKIYSDYFGLPYVRLLGKDIPVEVLNKIPYDVSKSFDILAYEFDGKVSPNILKIVVGDPSKLQSKAPAILSELKRQKNINIQLAVTSRHDFDYVLNSYQKKTINKPVENKPIEDKMMPEPAQKKVPAQSNPTNINNDLAEENKIVDLRNKPIPYEVLSKFPEDVSMRYQMVVFEAPTDDKIKVAILNPDENKVKEILNFVKEKNKIQIEVYKTTQQSLDWALRGFRNKTVTPEPEKEMVKPDLPAEKPHITLAKPIDIDKKPDVIPTPVEDSNIIPTVAQPEVVQKEEKPLPLERIQPETPVTSTSGPVPEVRINEVKSSELRQGVGARESTIRLEPTSEENEKNLDKLLPQGIKNNSELEGIVKAGFIPKTLAAILYFAVLQHASDIHIEADKKTLRLRYRVDGLLRDVMRLPLELQAPLVSRIKILSKLKIDEQRIPQDGRFEIFVANRDIDLRVSTLPTVNGEKAVLRILDKSSQLLNLKDLGMGAGALKILEDNIKKPYGVILATGPTGSGKTTTLYAIINTINKPDINVITLEDPVEYEIAGINQCQIKPKIGFGFAEGLRSVLRQDPNIIMVGEIRDRETASMATHAALTGHLVLTTLHTNDAPSALPRLINMGVEPFLITSAINCIMAQRLVRKICQKCKEELKVPEPVLNEIKAEIEKSTNSELNAYKNNPLKFYHGKGCPDCTDGFKGRVGVYEVLRMSEKIEDLAVKRMPATSIREQAISEGMLTIKEDGIIKAIKGITTLDEIMRVTSQ